MVKRPPHPMAVGPELREARAEWYAQNPWRPDWHANAEQQKGASLAMREAERTQGQHERTLTTARAITGGKPIHVTEYAA